MAGTALKGAYRPATRQDAFVLENGERALPEHVPHWSAFDHEHEGHNAGLWRVDRRDVQLLEYGGGPNTWRVLPSESGPCYIVFHCVHTLEEPRFTPEMRKHMKDTDASQGTDFGDGEGLMATSQLMQVAVRRGCTKILKKPKQFEWTPGRETESEFVSLMLEAGEEYTVAMSRRSAQYEFDKCDQPFVVSLYTMDKGLVIQEGEPEMVLSDGLATRRTVRQAKQAARKATNEASQARIELTFGVKQPKSNSTTRGAAKQAPKKPKIDPKPPVTKQASSEASNISEMSYMKLKRHLVASGVPKARVDQCMDKPSMVRLGAELGL